MPVANDAALTATHATGAPGNLALPVRARSLGWHRDRRVRAAVDRTDGPMPEALELPLTIPAELGPAAAVLSELHDRVRAGELERAAERARTGRREGDLYEVNSEE